MIGVTWYVKTTPHISGFSVSAYPACVRYFNGRQYVTYRHVTDREDGLYRHLDLSTLTFCDSPRKTFTRTRKLTVSLPEAPFPYGRVTQIHAAGKFFYAKPM